MDSGVKLYLAQGRLPSDVRASFLLETKLKIHYSQSSHYFGPMDISAIISFTETLDATIAKSEPFDKIVFRAQPGAEALSNAALLLGAYMVLKAGTAPEDVRSRFLAADPARFAAYPDSSPASEPQPDFRLLLIDCWRGLARARQLGWFAAPAAPGGAWGQVDPAAYAHYADPRNGAVHALVPGRLFAFRDPGDAPGGRELASERNGAYVSDLSPARQAEALARLGVVAVISLGCPHYDTAAFAAAGIAHRDLPCDGGAPPSAALVSAFLAAVDAARGAVAVHCAGEGEQTGALAALYLMRTHGFAAREAIAWLRMVRPGSVRGRCQSFLCAVDAELRDRRVPGRCRCRPPSPDNGAGVSVASAVRVAAVMLRSRRGAPDAGRTEEEGCAGSTKR